MSNFKKNGRGGKREGAGRPTLPADEKKKNITVKVTPEGDDVWADAARRLGRAKGDTVLHLIAYGNDELPKGLRDRAAKELS